MSLIVGLVFIFVVTSFTLIRRVGYIVREERAKGYRIRDNGRRVWIEVTDEKKYSAYLNRHFNELRPANRRAVAIAESDSRSKQNRQNVQDEK